MSESTLGTVDLEYGDRPLADVLDQVDSWASRPVHGLFLDRAPHDLPRLGAVVLAVRLARRHGFERIVLNPGRAVHARYRELGVEICTFAGDWVRYQRWSGEGSRPGDGHLVYAVPPAQHDAARRLMAWRRAGFGLVTASPNTHSPDLHDPGVLQVAITT